MYISAELAAEKVHKTSIVKMHLRQAHTTAGLTTHWWKWKFGKDPSQQEDNPNPIAAPPFIPEDAHVDVHDLMDELIRDSNNDTLEDDDPVPVLAIPPSRTASQWCIALASLFSYVERAGADCLEFYWKGGLRTIEWEVGAYDLMQGDKNTGLLDRTEHHGNTVDSGTSVQ
jgi:hypothetical protein